MIMKESIPIFIALIMVFILLTSTISAQENQQRAAFEASFRNICSIIEDRFYDVQLINGEFKAIKARYGGKIATISSKEEFVTLIRAMLGDLKSSHTAFYTRDDPEFYQLASIFHAIPEIKGLFRGSQIRYPSIGVITKEIGKKCFVYAVLNGSPAEKAGIRKGDEIVSADGKPFAPVRSLYTKNDVPVALEVRRAPGEAFLKFGVRPFYINPREEFMKAQNDSIRVIEEKGRKIGYIHIWCYAGNEFNNAFIDAISSGALKDAEALIWDLRDGWGGAEPAYLNTFNRNVPLLTMIDRNGISHPQDRQWRKPVVMLVNGRTRSGKEILAFGFKRFGIGAVLGEKTPGAVLGGRAFATKDGSLLYVAVVGCRVDGVLLEGYGVEPDVEIPMEIPYLQGRDIQVEKAIDYLYRELRKERRASTR
jgi:carboxyl-terminal processing protease